MGILLMPVAVAFAYFMITRVEVRDARRDFAVWVVLYTISIATIYAILILCVIFAAGYTS